MTIAYTYLQTSSAPLQRPTKQRTFAVGCAGPDRDRKHWADDTRADE
jgi:hypothetical protein